MTHTKYFTAQLCTDCTEVLCLNVTDRRGKFAGRLQVVILLCWQQAVTWQPSVQIGSIKLQPHQARQGGCWTARWTCHSHLTRHGGLQRMKGGRGWVATIFWYFAKFCFVCLLLKVFFLVKNIYWAIDLVLVFALESWARWAVRWQNTQQTSNNYNYNTVSRHRHADIAPPLLSPHYTLILRLSLPLTRSGFFVVRLTSKNLNISMRFKVFKSKY